MGITLSCAVCCVLCGGLVAAEPVSFSTSARWTLATGAENNNRKTWDGNRGVRAHFKSHYVWSSSAQNDLDLNVNITFNEVARGARRLLDATLLSALCPLRPCPMCGGKGEIYSHSVLGNSVLIETASYPCPSCAGWGKIPTQGGCIETTGGASKHNATHEMKENVLKLFIPPSKRKGEKVLYRPFESPFIKRLPVNDSLLENATHWHSQTKDGQFGSLYVTIEDIYLPKNLVTAKNPQLGIEDLALQATRISMHDDQQFHLIVPISPMEATFGFRRTFNIFEEHDDRTCESLQISREGKPTLLDNTMAIPIRLLFEQLCIANTSQPVLAETQVCDVPVDIDEYLVPYKNKAPIHDKEVEPSQAMLHIQFQVLNASAYQDAFMTYWNCTIVDVVEPSLSEGSVDGEEIIDLDASFPSEPVPPPAEPIIRREISCADTEFENERQQMFIKLQLNQESDKKYHNWLEFLTKI
jgi:hypothetical protein